MRIFAKQKCLFEKQSYCKNQIAHSSFMADVHDKNTRSYNMSRIKGSDTRPEMIVRKFLHAKGLRYCLYVRSLLGKPDLVFPKYKTVVFVNGCFWHGHKDCRYFVMPKTRTKWWKNKIEATIERDKKAEDELKLLGWKVIVIWECELKGKRERERRLKSLLYNIKSN